MPYTARGYRARELRRAMTEPEIILWSRLKRLCAEGFQFRRQAPFRGYYLDFVCFDRKLVIEVDGGHHSEGEQAAHDTVRDRVLEGEGFRVLRFGNSAVRQNLHGVMYSIRGALTGMDQVSPPVSRLRRETPSP
jgi:very-short-patch-repair endonuclease